MKNYFNFPGWDTVIAELPQDKRPKFFWVLIDETDCWVGDVETWIRQGTIKRINRVYLYDKNTIFDHIDWGGLADYPCPDKVQLLPVSECVEFADFESLPEELVCRIEDAIRQGWDDSEPEYMTIEELDDIPVINYPDNFDYQTSRHLLYLDYTIQKPEYDELTIGEVIEGLIEHYAGNPIW